MVHGWMLHRRTDGRTDDGRTRGFVGDSLAIADVGGLRLVRFVVSVVLIRRQSLFGWKTRLVLRRRIY